MTTKARNYRLETTFKDGRAVTVPLQAENDWKALDTLLCTAQEAVLSPANDVTTFCLLKERADGSWGRIARIMRDGDTDPDTDPYEGSFREAADNEGARIAAESHKDEDES